MNIDTEFKNLIPPITTEERTQLESSLNTEGCRDDLVVWHEEDILLDGHNRHAICEAYGIDYGIVEINLPSREAAREWIIRNQFGRRNLTLYQRAELALKLEPLIAAEAKEKQQEGGTDKVPQNSAKAIDTRKAVAEAAGVSHDTISKVKKIQEGADEETIDKVRGGEVSINAAHNAVKQGNVHFSSKSIECYTPPEIIERVLKVLKVIDLDPCSNSDTEPNVPARRHYTEADDGLNHVWHGKIFMNPPYGRQLPDWISLLIEEYAAGRVKEAIALVPSRTDTKWFMSLRPYARCFIWGRLKFVGQDNSAPFPSMVVYLGKRLNSFVAAFEDIGDSYNAV